MAELLSTKIDGTLEITDSIKGELVLNKTHSEGGVYKKDILITDTPSTLNITSMPKVGTFSVSGGKKQVNNKYEIVVSFNPIDFEAGEYTSQKLQIAGSIKVSNTATFTSGTSYTIYYTIDSKEYSSSFYGDGGTYTSLNINIEKEILLSSSGSNITINIIMTGVKTGNKSVSVTYSDISSLSVTPNVLGSKTQRLGSTIAIVNNPSSSDIVYAGGTYIGALPTQISQKVVIGVNGEPLAWLPTTSTSGWNLTSDRRDKIDFKNIDNSLSFLNKLTPVTFVDNSRTKYTNNKVLDEFSHSKGFKKGNRRIAGFIAQDVYQSMIDTYKDDNYAAIVSYSRYDEPYISEDKYYMSQTQLIPFLVGAVQELSKEVESLKQTIEDLKNK